MAGNLKDLGLALGKLEHEVADLRAPIGDVLDMIEEDVERRVDRGIDINGSKFAPLSAKYAKRKAKTHPGAPILKRTRAMLSGANIRRKIWVRSGRLRYTSEYAGFHQEGGGNLPKREFAGISDDADKGMDDIIGDWLDKMLRKNLKR